MVARHGATYTVFLLYILSVTFEFHIIKLFIESNALNRLPCYPI